MTIEDFDQALQEQGSSIQQAFGTLCRMEVREAMETAPDDAGWDLWA
jgi:hypothetical protein